MMITAVLSSMILATSICLGDQTVDWTKNCNRCKCVWSGGKKTADCTNLNLTNIPTDLSNEIREIDFSHNPMYGLGVKAFVKMKDVHKLKLQSCQLGSLDKTAFRELLLLIELDLSRNNLKEIDKDIFRDNKKLRILNLSFNKLNSLTSHLFHNLTQLQRIILNNNNISWMGESVFVNLPSLQHIDLGNNKLQRIVNDFTKDLRKFNSLNVEGNLWICDCKLEPFRNKTIKENWISTPTNCTEPPRLRGKSWSDPVVFACAPKISDPQSMTSIEASTANVTISCKAIGQPAPHVDWMTNGRIISKDPRQHIQKYVLSKSIDVDSAWNNLTIINVNSRDRGEYKCLAKNDGGVDEHNVTLIVSSGPISAGGGSIMQPIEGLIPVIIGVIVTLIFLIVIILLLLCWCRKPLPRNGADRKGGDNESSSEYINLHGQPDMEKSLITDVNPVVKPPRFVMPSPMGLNSGGTEVSDVKRNLLDNDSVYIGDDESRSSDFDQQSRRTENMLDLRHPYPPDLLPPFPHRTSQVSPAGSSASTVADTSRLPALHGPQSPLHSPYYDHIYRTLPHSRSHSPFIPVPPFVPRQGYVTIPRRPRQQSWSSEPPEIAQPLYDNLGVRSTATGSSMNSLNKADTPKANRMLPAIPTNCDPIAEHDSPPSASVTLPRNMNQKLSPSRTNWARANAEAFQSPDRRNSLSIFPASDQKLSKIPPRPPPKPKKNTPTRPLFEDEGEDGTEV
ncbi:hypothetical protein WA026_009602 [Henosepilachna vigintioctopunctata]|uniref:Ig-like domain-containing protein n=1 Tax=Henosepilachna vigintioctopunctata TaxID=420089 RepID=A0AAW1TW68_9CUCU